MANTRNSKSIGPTSICVTALAVTGALSGLEQAPSGCARSERCHSGGGDGQEAQNVRDVDHCVTAEYPKQGTGNAGTNLLLCAI